MNQSINTDSKNKQQQGTTTEAPPWNGQYKNTGGLKPVLRVPNLALSFYHVPIMAQNIQLFGPREGFLTHLLPKIW